MDRFAIRHTVPAATTTLRFRFGAFELDQRSRTLQRDGVTICLQDQSLRVLLTLVEHAGEVVTREQLGRQLWDLAAPGEVDYRLNTIVKPLRAALNDSAENPTFIETVPRRGYRFLARVEVVGIDDAAGLPLVPITSTSQEEDPVASEPSATRSSPKPPAGRRIVALTVAAALVGSVVVGRQMFAGRRVHQARLAVLPFQNLTGDDDQFFADGLHEEMIVRLGRMHPGRLAVIARTSVLPYRGASKSVATIARELGVDYVLEGSVRRAGERFRITAQLIRADNQSQLWTETYERSWKDVFEIQADVGARVADSLAVALVPPYEAAEDGRDRHVSPQAYEHYLRGRFYWNQRARDPVSQLARAIEHLKLAVADQPDYALAYAGLADAYNSMLFANPGFGEEAEANARHAVQQALRLDGRLASAHSTLAWMTLHFDHDLPLAEQRFRRALELDPNDSLARFRLSHVLAARGRVREAEAEAEAARRSDPLSAPIADILAWYAYYRGANGQALQRMSEAADLEGDPMKRHLFAAYLAAVGGACDRATSELGPPPLAADVLRLAEAAFVVARCSDGSAADRVLRDLTARRLAYPAAMLQFGRGDLSGFYDRLDRAIDQRFPELLYLGVDPVFSSERQTARFQAVLRRLGI